MVSQARLFAAFALVAIATAVSVDHHVVELGTAVPVITCPAGSLKSESGNSATCTACAAGKFSAASATACTPCAAGTFAAASGASACPSCAAGKFAATAGTAATSGATQCCGTLDKGKPANRAARSRTDATPCSYLCNECRFYRGTPPAPRQLCVNWVKRNENNPLPKAQWTAKTADDAKC